MSKDSSLYERAPSAALSALLAPGGFLAPLTDLKDRKVAGLYLDVHLRADDEMHIYCGLTRLMNVRRNNSGTLKASAHRTFSRQACAKELLSTWKMSESEGFNKALDAYLRGVKVDPRHTASEGEVQSMWAQVTEPWTPFDKAAVLGGQGKEHERVKTARAALEEIAASQGKSSGRRGSWSEPPAKGREVDQLAVDPEGRLVLFELKDAKAGNAPVYYAPFQLLQYVWDWHEALECVRVRLQNLIDARVELGLTPGTIPRLTGGIRAAVCFANDTRTEEVWRRYEMVLEEVNRHLPPCVPRIETWELEYRPPEEFPDLRIQSVPSLPGRREIEAVGPRERDDRHRIFHRGGALRVGAAWRAARRETFG